MSLAHTLADHLLTLRQANPLVLNLTNYVVMNNTANALLAIGASPIMAHSREETGELLAFCSALVVNIGTLDRPWIERMAFAIEQANAHGKPVVLDPVGCGASSLRTRTARRLANLADTLVLRGNASEILALAGTDSNAKGVDAQDASADAVAAAKRLLAEGAQEVVISGATDFVVNHQGVVQLDNGHALMPKVTGMGCTHTALTGAFAGVCARPGLAATAVLGVAGALAAQQAKGPGTLQLHLLDALHNLDADTLLAELKLDEVPL